MTCCQKAPSHYLNQCWFNIGTVWCHSAKGNGNGKDHKINHCNAAFENNTCDINILRPRQNGRHLPDDILKCVSLNENVWISIEISLKFVHKVSINNIPALVQIMAWRRPGDKPLSGPMMVILPTHICVTRPQWVKSQPPGINEFKWQFCTTVKPVCNDHLSNKMHYLWFIQ